MTESVKRAEIVESEEPLARITIDVCRACLAGIGGECHTPGCAFWMNRAPDIPLVYVQRAGSDHA